ncbi:hypothetical protein JCM9279_007457 [Rhodotorula babjevae]
MNGYPPPQPITSPFNQPSPLTAPRPQPPPSAIPSERLANTADAWARGSTASPAPPPSMTSLNAAYAPAPQPPMPPAPPPGGYYASQPYGAAPPPPQGDYLAARPASYSVGQSVPQSLYGAADPMQGRPASYAAPMSGPYGAMPPQPPQPPVQPGGYLPPPPPPQAGYLLPVPPSMMMGGGPPPSAPGQMQGGSGFVQRPPRAASMQPSDFAALSGGFDAMSLGGGGAGGGAGAPGGYLPGKQGRPNYYANPEDGPPHKLAVTHPDQPMLASMRDTALANGGDPQRKVAWAKQVLKFIERHQASAGESSRISDPTLVRWTDEALNHILASASSANPVPLALYLRGDLSASGSFPSYRSKDLKSSFRDFEAAANAGYVKAWFRIGRAYEDFGDIRRAVGAYEKGVEKGDCGSTYRLAMAYLLGQIGVQGDIPKALGLLRRAADSADLDTPQPPYILGMLLSGEFDSPSVQLDKSQIPLDMDEARWRIERSAYLSFGPAQYKMGYSYEYASLGCLFDPLLSVQYYALASQNSEVEADMALSKWYLCGSEGHFEANEKLAVTFAEKAAAKQHPSAEFALGYYHEVGIAGPIDLDKARRWYSRAAGHGNEDAKQRLDALQQSNPAALNRTDHDAHLENKLVRKRTQAKVRSDAQRDRLAANQLAANLSGARLSSSQGPSGPRPPQINVPAAQAQYQQPQQPYRQGTAGSVASSSSSSYRRNTIKQVEAAVQMAPPPPSTPNPMRPPPQQQHLQQQQQQRYPSPGPPRPQSYQLSDAPPSSLPTTQRPQQQVSRPQTIPVSQQLADQHKPATFAEMGIKTSKAKREECVCM